MVKEIISLHKSGIPVGVPSLCSSNRLVLEAAMAFAAANHIPLLIESTSNQVDQFGGYMGMTPPQFRVYVEAIAGKIKFPVDRITFGGDHLGPNTWQLKPSAAAMLNAKQLIESYVAAGFTKIHLDASMPCGGDGDNFNEELIAARTAELCEVAEQTAKRTGNSQLPVYIIGSEVPIPGGAQENIGELPITKVDNVQATLEITHREFYRRGLQDAWERVAGIVVQPGVEFGDDQVVRYNSNNAAALTAYIETIPNIVFEAHSTDYQSSIALQQLVNDHFAILKVGPWLTYALREALLALASIEEEIAACNAAIQSSHLSRAIEHVMNQYPQYWVKHYHGSAEQIAIKKKFSYSDRIRYYWTMPELTDAVNTMLANLSRCNIPLTLLSQYLPNQYSAIFNNAIANTPTAIIYDKLSEVFHAYFNACHLLISSPMTISRPVHN